MVGPVEDDATLGADQPGPASGITTLIGGRLVVRPVDSIHVERVEGEAELGLVAKPAFEWRAHPIRPGGGVQDPRPLLEGWVLTHMLVVATAQRGNPIAESSPKSQGPNHNDRCHCHDGQFGTRRVRARFRPTHVELHLSMHDVPQAVPGAVQIHSSRVQDDGA